MSSTPTIAEIVAKVPGKPSAKWRMIFGVMLLIGVVAFGMTLMANPQRAWSSMLHQLVYWLPFAQVGVVLAAIFIIVKAKWAIPVHRMALGTGVFLPIVFLLLVITLLLGNQYIFSWIDHPVESKASYLNLPWLLIRQVGMVGFLSLLSFGFMRRIRRLDAGLAAPHAQGDNKARFEKWSKGWKGDAEELASANRVLPRFAAAIIPLYAIVYTFVCWDLIQSLDPHFATTMLGAWYFMSGILMGFASLALISLILRKQYKLEEYLTPTRYHQLGKLIFAFSVFWMYLFFSMYLPMWYANMPEEAHWIVLRVNQPFLPWAITAVVLTWMVPFAGFMNLAAKKNPMSHMFFAIVVLTGLWFERLVLTYPSIYLTDMPVGFPEVGLTLGFIGAFGLMYQGYAATRPLIALDRLDDLEEGHP